ncbi:TPA: NACHT domain-containing NTPase [Klebsiella pneumoniae]
MQPVTLDGMIAASLPWAKEVIKNKIIPIISSRVKDYLDDVRAARFLNDSMEKFLSRVGGQCSLVNTLAFQNTPIELKKIYEPISVYHDNEQSNYECLINNKIDILNSYNHILITDSAGMGKSTLMKRIALYCIEETNQIPIYLELRRIQDYSIAEQVKNQLGLGKNISNACLKEIPFIYLFDGIDEIPQGIKSSVVNSLREFADDFLSTPLYVSLLFCAYKFKPIIPRKKELFYSQVFDALFESHDLTKELGYVREKHSKLDSTDFHQILRRLGFWCLKEGGRIEFTKDDLQIIIKEIASKIPGLTISASLFIKDLIETVPLFVKEGAIIRWSHKSLMEYFAAMFICRDTKERQRGILRTLYKNDESIRHKNLFELCADIDYSTFRSSVIKNLLEDYVHLYEKISQRSITSTPKEVISKVELLFPGRSLIYIFSKGEENKTLSKLINGDFREFKELNTKDGYLNTTFADIGNAWVVIARNETIISHVLSILKVKNPEYFHSNHRLTSDDTNLTLEVRRAIRHDDEVKIDVNFENILNCNGKTNLNLISGILTFDKTPQLKYRKALAELDKINFDDSNGINQLLEGF